MEFRVLNLLSEAPLAKAGIFEGLGHKEVSGQLNKVIRLLLADQHIVIMKETLTTSDLLD